MHGCGSTTLCATTRAHVLKSTRFWAVRTVGVRQCGGNASCDLRGWGRRSRTLGRGLGNLCATTRTRGKVCTLLKSTRFWAGVRTVRRDATGCGGRAEARLQLRCDVPLLLLLLQVLGRGLVRVGLILPLLLLRAVARLGVGSGVVGHLRRGRIGGFHVSATWGGAEPRRSCQDSRDRV